MTTKIQILHLEDNLADRELVREMLADGGIEYDVVSVCTRQEFTDSLQGREWDLILADYSLPHFDGLSALNIARQLCPRTPFIFVSGVMGEDVAVESLKTGATDYVLKQHIKRLCPAVRRALKESEIAAHLNLASDQALSAARRSEELFRGLLESAPDAVVVMNTRGEITMVNHQTDQLFGYQRNELLGQKIEVLLPERFRESHQQKRQTFLTRPQVRPMGKELDLYGKRQDGTEFPVEVSLSPFETLEELLIFGSVRDISERKRIAEELARRAEELERSNAELQQFAYVASHDLQEPLRMVASFTQLLAQRYQGKLDADADEFIGYVVDGAHRMQELVNDLLAYSRVGTQGQKFAAVDCENVLHTVLTNLQKALEESGGQVTHDHLPTVYGDKTQLGQVLQNLVANALKFRSSEPPRVHISAQEINGEWRFSVRDNGIGIDPEHAERIFVLFQRLHTRDKYPGTGIGLSIAKKIVERHGGRIWVESEAGEGSTFYFSLPMKGTTHGKVVRGSTTH